ncbi:MAG: VanW family protein [Coriobacteriia bacterium]|nr:VanW family protein [Coriobacteriia bacterium]
MSENEKKLFCEMNPVFYAISERKGIITRCLKNIFGGTKFAHEIDAKRLPNVVSSHHSHLIKKGPGIDPELQYNKATNIDLACRTFNGLIVHPGQVFSFWVCVGNPCKRRGYKEGRVIEGENLIHGVGGGLCNLGNTVHLVVLHSPLEVIELHHHSDALAADPGGVRVPYSAGTSVSYNYIDFRFRNNTDQDVQLCAWVEGEELYAELRSEREFPYTYELQEEGHHFHKEGDDYYRIGKIYKVTKDRATGEVINRELNWDNHSKVMFTHDQIPPEQIR